MDDTTSWTRLSRLLDEALDVSPAQRDVWLARLELHGDPLIPQLRELLAHEPSVRASDFLGEGPDLEDPSTSALDSSGLSPSGNDAIGRHGKVVGPYRLVSRLGRGGMGEVWLAERADGLFQRTVALKLPLGRWPRTDFVERLARERDILAALNHPNIARLYDAGVTADGRPYLALEYVEGRPIDAYCDAAAEGVRARLEVFLQVLDAVAYAHGRLVIHRDLKPSNILVTDDGHVRLLDFGVAKLLENGRARRSALTELAGEPRTPEYASPEQIAEEPLGTASDVYSLGVVLYELLTGRRPYRVTRDSIRALEAAVLEADPDPPSEAVPDRAHSKALKGDLDTIILRALKKKPAERYASVDAFAQDLRNYLAGYPVRARADRWWYRLSRLVARNQLATAAIAVAVMSLVVFGAVSAWQARVLAGERRVAATERDTAEQVVRVLITNVAAFDGGIATWNEKYRHDAVRPTSAIHFLYGNRLISGWGGPGKGTVTDLPGREWRSYLATGNHPEYPSGSACFCAAHSQASRRYLGSDAFGWSVTVPAGSSVIEPGVTPAAEITLGPWATFTEFEEDCQSSRLWGGVHFQSALTSGQQLCKPIGDLAFEFVDRHIRGIVR